MDDCTIAVSNLCLIKNFKAGLYEHIEVTDPGKLHWMLGIEIKQDRDACITMIHLS
jgi:hypothetical protein